MIGIICIENLKKTKTEKKIRRKIKLTREENEETAIGLGCTSDNVEIHNDLELTEGHTKLT